jgi:hypothetical protein
LWAVALVGGLDAYIDAAHFVDDVVRHPRGQRVRQLGPVRGHEVLLLHGAQRDDVLVGAAVAHDADAAHRQEHREGLADLVVPVGGAQPVDEYRVGAA